MFINYIPIWKKAPFLRLLIPLTIGIILQWDFQFPLSSLWLIFGTSLLSLFSRFFLRGFHRYKLRSLNGVVITVAFLSLGSLLTWYKDVRNNNNWYARYYEQGGLLKVTLQEPLVEKTNSYKAVAEATALKLPNKIISVRGGLIVYFKKGSIFPPLDVGSQIIFLKPIQEIKNAGNPGGFDYKRYCLFQNITHQVYLKAGDFIVLEKKQNTLPGKILFPIRKKTISILQTYIYGKKEYGLAEALLIGFKDDLDKDLVQSYANTGVVHIIVIAGLHLGMIYWLLVLFFRPLKKRRKLKWLYAVIIISGLWLFSLLTGAHAPVIRSAVIFTFIVLAEVLDRKSVVYNTLALSAFILLCYNPFWLWDAGFQLSYSAVVSIVTFTQPVYNWFYITNKALDFIWKINSVSIAAQFLTIPLSIYHFHQFPNLFLLTNVVAVPLAIIILLGEIFLWVISLIPFIASLLGKILSWLIWLMNSYIERIELLPYSLWDGLQISVLQAALLALVTAGFGYWLLEKRKSGFWLGISAVLFFVVLRSVSFYQSYQQQKLIVYNIPKHEGIDILNGRKYFFIGDTDLLADDFLNNFHIKPCHTLNRVTSTAHLSNLVRHEGLLQYGSRKLLLIDRDYFFDTAQKKIKIDVLIISKNPKLCLPTLIKTFNFKRVVFDGSVPGQKVKHWSKNCDSLHIPYYNVNDNGAFVMNLN